MHAAQTVRPSRILAPGDPGWDTARQAWNLAADQRPAAIAVPRTARDVAAAIAFARERGLQAAAQGTGHNAAPLGPLDDTVLIRTRAMRAIRLDRPAGPPASRPGRSGGR
jgi:FAD/FMN-containing dehydrogenase